MTKIPTLVTFLPVALFAASGCADRPEKDVSPPSPSIATTSEPTTRATAQNADQEILDAVFNDLLTANDSPLFVRDAPPKEMQVSPKPSPYPRTAEQVLLRRDKRWWDSLSAAQLAAAKEAAGDLVRRHERGDGLGSFHLRDARVKFSEPSSTTKVGNVSLPRMDRPVQVYLPGYTSDGKFAAVSLNVPWSMHHTDATYLLECQSDGSWKIVLRQFVYYV